MKKDEMVERPGGCYHGEVTMTMVKYWLGLENAAEVLQEIANSKDDEKPWTPKILHNDIVETWKEKRSNK